MHNEALSGINLLNSSSQPLNGKPVIWRFRGRPDQATRRRPDAI